MGASRKPYTGNCCYELLRSYGLKYVRGHVDTGVFCKWKSKER